MRTRTYKTMNGLLNACRQNYVNADKFFGGKFYCYKPNGGSWYAKPSDELRAEVAIAFEKRHWTKSNPRRLEALKRGEYYADFSFLQCFYVTEKEPYDYCYGTCLSGEAYDYCRRKFTQSVW